MHKFICKADYTYEITGKGTAYVVRNPVRCYSFNHLLGKEILLNGEIRKVIGVERHAHNPPWDKDEPISILVEPQ